MFRIWCIVLPNLMKENIFFFINKRVLQHYFEASECLCNYRIGAARKEKAKPSCYTSGPVRMSVSGYASTVDSTISYTMRHFPLMTSMVGSIVLCNCNRA